MEYNMDNEIALKIGNRCREIRMAKGMSQAKLAEKAGTTPQNISKYEKEGIYDIRWIRLLSNILGQDLEKDSADEEGTVGEIGKEILFRLIEHGGYIYTNELNKYLYGLDSDRINNELFKLGRIGMIVREELCDWDSSETNIIFITAKGMITFKNMRLNDEQREMVTGNSQSTITYEEAVSEYGSYQEYIDSNEVEKIVRGFKYRLDIPWYKKDGDELSSDGDWSGCSEEDMYEDSFLDEIKTDHRINYISYLKKNYQNDIYSDDDMGFFVPGVSCYHDILFRMALKLTHEKMMWNVLGCGRMAVEKEYDEFEEESRVYDAAVAMAERSFLLEFEWLDIESRPQQLGEEFERTNQYLADAIYAETGMGITEFMKCLEANPENDNSEWTGKVTDVLERMNKLLTAVSIHTTDAELGDLEAFYERNRPENGSATPVDWFTEEEIRAFIIDNMGPAESEEEKWIDCQLARINQLCPDTLDYYVFPREWEENGLADLVRENCGIKK